MKKEMLEKSASALGCIKVYVSRVKRLKREKPRTRRGMFNPISKDTSKEMVKEKHISHVVV